MEGWGKTTKEKKNKENELINENMRIYMKMMRGEERRKQRDVEQMNDIITVIVIVIAISDDFERMKWREGQCLH